MLAGVIPSACGTFTKQTGHFKDQIAAEIAINE